MILRVVFERIGLLIIVGGMLEHDCINDHDLYDEWPPDAIICIIARSPPRSKMSCCFVFGLVPQGAHRPVWSKYTHLRIVFNANLTTSQCCLAKIPNARDTTCSFLYNNFLSSECIVISTRRPAQPKECLAP